jgi:hypothetical protein
VSVQARGSSITRRGLVGTISGTNLGIPRSVLVRGAGSARVPSGSLTDPRPLPDCRTMIVRPSHGVRPFACTSSLERWRRGHCRFGCDHQPAIRQPRTPGGLAGSPSRPRGRVPDAPSPRGGRWRPRAAPEQLPPVSPGDSSTRHRLPPLPSLTERRARRATSRWCRACRYRPARRRTSEPRSRLPWRGRARRSRLG